MTEDINDYVKPVKLCNCGAQPPSSACDPGCPDDLGTYRLAGKYCDALLELDKAEDALKLSGKYCDALPEWEKAEAPVDSEPLNRRDVDIAIPDPVEEMEDAVFDPDKAQKYDDGKAPLAWIPREYLEGTAKVLAFGGKKYAPGNWAKGGFTTSQLSSAALRHLYAFNAGENVDPESGLSHLYHASCMLAFLSTLIERDNIDDDRIMVGAQDSE